MDKKVPSRWDIQNLAIEYGIMVGPLLKGKNHAHLSEIDRLEAFASAILARYGQPAQPTASTEPYAYIRTIDLGNGNSQVDLIAADIVGDLSQYTKIASFEPLFRRAAPVSAQPSVPEPLKYGREWKDHYVTGWNNCRAAMLAAEPCV